MRWSTKIEIVLQQNMILKNKCTCFLHHFYFSRMTIVSRQNYFQLQTIQMNIFLFVLSESKDVILHKKMHRRKGYRGHKQEENTKDVIPTPPPLTPTPTPTPSTTLETEDVDLDAQSAEDMRRESVSTETTGTFMPKITFHCR